MLTPTVSAEAWSPFAIPPPILPSYGREELGSDGGIPRAPHPLGMVRELEEAVLSGRGGEFRYGAIGNRSDRRGSEGGRESFDLGHSGGRTGRWGNFGSGHIGGRRSFYGGRSGSD
ncbi:Kynurenine formamidase [Olea europaea subsp. europaea]|uniref:Kynurenine formamidase n=1 Tax=Olea europaea subsp. europaea TaxID=158383 RepID=A0A8S0PWA0_OLEEU|nr:Kynurenine formamidase [Olea europaea subsp. europaea]